MRTGEFWPADCDSGVCELCGVHRARVRARLLTIRMQEVGRARFITLTQAPREWQERRGQVRDLARRLRGEGYQCEWCWVTERGGQTGMIHVHALQWGDYVPQAVLQDRWGGRRVDIRAAVSQHATYIEKSAARVASYIGKGAVGNLDEALDLNGGRLHHWSREFWGMPIRDYRAAHRTYDGGQFGLVFRPDLRDDWRGVPSSRAEGERMVTERQVH